MKLVRLFLLSLTCLATLIVTGQNVFDRASIQYTKYQQEAFIDFVELPSTNLIFVGTESTMDRSSQQICLFKTNLIGSLIDSAYLVLPADSFYTLVNACNYKQGVLVSGYAGKRTNLVGDTLVKNTLCFWYFNGSMELLESHFLEIPISLPFTVFDAKFNINDKGAIYGTISLKLLVLEGSLGLVGTHLNAFYILDNAFNIAHFKLDSVIYTSHKFPSSRTYLDFTSTEFLQTQANSYVAFRAPNGDQNPHQFFSSYDSVLSDRKRSVAFYSSGVNTYYQNYGRYVGLLADKDLNFITLGNYKMLGNLQAGNYFGLARLREDTTIYGQTTDSVFEWKQVNLFNFQSVFEGQEERFTFPAYKTSMARMKNGTIVLAAMLGHLPEEKTPVGMRLADTLYLAVYTPDFNRVWERKFFNNEQITLHSLHVLSSGDIAAVGLTHNYVSDFTNSSSDYFAIKLSANGEVINGLEEAKFNPTIVNVYPNPFSNSISLECNQTIENVVLLDVFGRIVLSQVEPEKVIHLATLAPGNYILKISFKNGQQVVKNLLSK